WRPRTSPATSFGASSFVGLRLEPEPLVGERRLRSEEWVVDAEDPAALQAQPLDLPALVLVEDAVVAAVGDHGPHPLLGARGQAAPLLGLREPEIHRQRVIEDDVLLDVEVLVDEHVEEAVVARAGDDVESIGLQDVDVDPSEAEAVAELAEVVERL